MGFLAAFRILMTATLAAAGGGVRAAPAIDSLAPALVGTAIDGQSFDLGKWRGKVVLVNYWATWCAPCKREIPILNALYKRYHRSGLEVIGISADRPQDFAKMRKMSTMFAYPVAVLNQISDNGFGSPEGFPLTYVIDGNGVVRDKFIELREQLLRDVVLPLLPN